MLALEVSDDGIIPINSARERERESAAIWLRVLYIDSGILKFSASSKGGIKGGRPSLLCPWRDRSFLFPPRSMLKQSYSCAPKPYSSTSRAGHFIGVQIDGMSRASLSASSQGTDFLSLGAGIDAAMQKSSLLVLWRDDIAKGPNQLPFWHNGQVRLLRTS